ncbi:MAG: DUF1998 domain-containing protein, partial [Armatimonadota bacterium]|nr:DUF1998 domain-containing protein [Armatimonadota bacterium]
LPEALVRDLSNEQIESALLGLSHALHNAAPLFLMCDPRDLGRTCQIRAPHTGRPTLFLYDAVPGGVGLAERLYGFHAALWEAAAELVAGCPCPAGCPSCVGPPLEVGTDGKTLARALLRAEVP